MAVFIVGDIHGCFDELRVLLTQAGFNKDRDQLMTTGDIVGRGPKSLDTIKFIRENGAVTVLGNHDLNAIACAMGLRKVKPRPSRRAPRGPRARGAHRLAQEAPGHVPPS